MRKTLLLALAVPLLAQDPLSLRDAVRLALHLVDGDRVEVRQ